MKGTELERIQQEADSIIESEVAGAQTAEQAKELYFLLGGLDAIGTISDNLNAALIFNYQRIRDERLYLSVGFQRFDDFMDNHPKSRMSYKRFNYIEGVYNSLGPVTFDLMSGSGLSMRQMKALGKGHVEVEGDHVVVTADDGSRESIEISNRRQWLDAVTTLAKAKSDGDEKNKRLQKTIEDRERTIKNVHEDLDRERARKLSEVNQDPHSMALANATFALAALRSEAEDLSPIDRAARRDNVLEVLAGCMEQLRQAYRSDGTERPVDALVYEDDDDPDLKWAVDYVRDLPVDNESDLASKL